jgi:hypothetical protein
MGSVRLRSGQGSNSPRRRCAGGSQVRFRYPATESEFPPEEALNHAALTINGSKPSKADEKRQRIRCGPIVSARKNRFSAGNPNDETWLTL